MLVSSSDIDDRLNVILPLRLKNTASAPSLNFSVLRFYDSIIPRDNAIFAEIFTHKLHIWKIVVASLIKLHGIVLERHLLSVFVHSKHCPISWNRAVGLQKI